MTKQPDSDFVLKVTKTGKPCWGSHKDYVVEQRNVFYSEFSVQIQKKEIEDLREKIEKEKCYISGQEIDIQKEEEKFRDWLRDQDTTAKQFLNSLEESSKRAVKKDEEIKVLKSSVTLLRSEIEKCENALKEYKEYEKFLHSVSEEGFSKESSEDPKAILLVLRKIQTDCVTLMQYNHDQDKELKRKTRNAESAQNDLDKQIAIFHTPKEEIEKLIVKEQNRIHALKALLSQIDEQLTTDDVREKSRVHSEINDVYKTCIGQEVVSIGVDNMLHNIEKKLFKLLESMKKYPIERLESAEKAKHRKQIRRKKEERLEALKQRSFQRPPKALVK